MSRFITDENGNRKRIRTEADIRAVRKWAAVHNSDYSIVAYKARKEYADRVKAAAAANGTTVSAIIHAALDAYLAEHEKHD